MAKSKGLMVAVIVVLVVAFVGLGGHELLTLDNLRSSQARLEAWTASNFLLAVGVYTLAYRGHCSVLAWRHGDDPRRWRTAG